MASEEATRAGIQPTDEEANTPSVASDGGYIWLASSGASPLSTRRGEASRDPVRRPTPSSRRPPAAAARARDAGPCPETTQGRDRARRQSEPPRASARPARQATHDAGRRGQSPTRAPLRPPAELP